MEEFVMDPPIFCDGCEYNTWELLRRQDMCHISVQGMVQRWLSLLRLKTGALTFFGTGMLSKNLPWQNGLFEESLKAAGLSGLDAGSKLYISNLDFGVSNEDIRELFSEIGELIRYAIHFVKNGLPSGSAEVVFARRSDAFQALKRYNNVQLDGKPMKMEIVGANSEIPLSARVNVFGVANGKKRTVVMASGPGRSRGGFAAANRGSGQRGRGSSNTGRGGGAVDVVVEEAHSGEKKLWRNQWINLTKNWTVITQKQCRPDISAYQGVIASNDKMLNRIMQSVVTLNCCMGFSLWIMTLLLS